MIQFLKTYAHIIGILLVVLGGSLYWFSPGRNFDTLYGLLGGIGFGGIVFSICNHLHSDHH